MGFLRKIGRGFKKIGSGLKQVGLGARWLVRRPEFFVASRLIPIPGLRIAVDLVSAVEDGVHLGDKMTMVYAELAPILAAKYGITKESEIRWVVETAVQIMEGKVELNNYDRG